MAKLSIKDLQLKGKRLLMRVDFNVPQDETGKITDDIRIKASLATIQYALEKGVSKLILMSHLGRPDGQVKEKLRLDPIAKRLSELLGQSVLKLDDCIGEKIAKLIENSRERVVLLENLRFHKQEEENDPAFSEELAKLGDYFVNDAFGTAHRAHASTEGVAHYLESAAGFLLEKEIKYLGEALENPAKPFAVILGGAKVSDKIAVIENLLPKAQTFLIGGGMAYTLLKAKGIEIGKSKLEADKINFAKELLQKAEKLNKKIVLPVDHVVADSLANPKTAKLINDVNIGADYVGLDIGPKTIELFKAQLREAKTIVWNGPVGVSEVKAFSRGTKELMEFIANLKVVSILGGGDTAAAASQFGVTEKITHISTGGGASLEYMEGKVLPGVAALTDK